MDTSAARPNHDSLRFRIASALILLIGTALSFIAFFATYSKQEQTLTSRFNEAALSRVEVIRASFENCLEVMKSMGAYFEADNDIAREEFTIFIKHIQDMAPGVQALEWVPRVSAAQRAHYEAQARKFVPSFTFTERQADGKFAPRRVSGEYLPIYYIEPYAGNEFALGFDIASHPARRAVMQLARDSGKLQVSPRFLLLKEQGFILFYPVYKKNTVSRSVLERRNNFKGLAVGVFRVKEAVETALKQLPPGGLDIGLYEDERRSPQQLLYWHASRTRSSALATGKPNPLEHVAPLKIAGQSWSLRLTPAPGYFTTPIPWVAWAELIIGIVLSGLLAGYVETIRRHQKALFRENIRRNALRTHFDYLVKYANDIIVLADDSGKIIEVNDSACAAYGYSREELLQLKVQELSIDEMQQQLYLNMYGMGEEGLIYETVERRKDGSTFPVEVSARRIAINSQYFWQAIARDITERKEQDAALSRVNRALRVLSECTVAMVHASSEQSLLQEICRLIVETGHYPLAWIGYAEEDEGKTVRPMAQSGDRGGNRDQLKVSWAVIEHGQEPTGAAIREGTPQIYQDFTHNPKLAAWREMALKRGFQASMAVPLRTQSRVIGAMMIYAAEPNAFDAEEVKLLQELADDLSFGITSLREAQERQRIQRELDYQSHYDALTGLPNRSLLHHQLTLALPRASSTSTKLAVALLTLDRFDAINDGLGHAAGDALLKHIGQRLLTTLRAGDTTVAHFSGSEFAVLINEIESQEELIAIARHLLAEIIEHFQLNGQEIFTTASIGLALYPKDGDNADKLLRNAGAAMFKAKSEGGNTFRFYAPEMNEQIAAKLALEIDLRKALERGELQVHFQPKVSLTTGRIVGAEALVRWLHPSLGLLMPANFIAMAEETGLIQYVGEWVFQCVCRQLQTWLKQGLKPLPIAVNLSARQFRQGTLHESLQRCLDAAGVEAKWLELEITESTLMVDTEAAIATLRQLKTMGFSLSLDDFGTGYSSLSYLRHLPIDYLKIDQSFVRNLTSEPEDAAICRTIIDLAHNLKLTVVAEGVESEGQLNYLCRHGCDVMQGYYFSPPLPTDGFSWLLNENKMLVLPDDQHGSKTILLLDDDSSVLLQLQYLLQANNYQVYAANRVEEAFELLASYPIQIVLSDQRMLGMDGTEFLAKVREIHPNVLRMLMTGSLDPKTFSDSINRGAIYKFIPKPWDDQQLLEQVSEAFRYYDSMYSHDGVSHLAGKQLAAPLRHKASRQNDKSK
jgi:diguanylate cyclase (GGDEF)-like protein/PAS domain S-box-containing protein